MKTLTFARRNTKEMLRDKINFFFGLGFPVVLLLLLSMINSNMPIEIFTSIRLTPGIAMFGFSFIALFSGMVISRDRTSSLMMRLMTSPIRSSNFILGYVVPLIPMSIAQSIICFAVAIPLGLDVTYNMLLSILVLLPSAFVFIGIGLICGSVMNEKQVGGVCGALLTNLSAWFSGTWFDVSIAGGVFEKIADFLPFVHAVNAGRYALSGEYDLIMGELVTVIIYAVVLIVLAIIIFNRKIAGDK